MAAYGIDHIKSYKEWIADGRVGLLTSITGRDSQNRSTISILQEMCNLTALFGPEHGVRGDLAAGVMVENNVDFATGLPVYSLYGGEGKHISQEQLDCFDILVYDIQDIGVRYYTFLSTLHNVLMDCAKAGKRFVVLDRPNPLGGAIVEGGILDMDYSSFVGCYPLPVRYGLTSGEAAMMMNAEMNYGCDLKIVPCSGWKRNSLFSDWGKLWPMPSLGLPTFETTLLYPGTCLIEGTNLSEGRGTAAPFRIIGAPFVDAEALTAAFNQIGLAGVIATPVWFQPTASKYQGEQCGGILLHVTDAAVLRPVTVGVNLLHILRTMYPEDYTILPPYKIGGRPFLALLSGGADLTGDWDMAALLERYEAESMAFIKRKNCYHIYD